MKWTWDETKNAANRQVHQLGFEAAALVFQDPLALTQGDPHPDEQRWRTMGMVGSQVLVVVHTEPQELAGTGEEIGRIISARKATKAERKAYEEGDE